MWKDTFIIDEIYLKIYRYFSTINMSGTNDSITTSFLCGLRGFHVHQDISKPVIRETLHCINERNNNHDRYAIRVATKRLPGRLADSIEGHFPRQISRYTIFNDPLSYRVALKFLSPALHRT